MNILGVIPARYQSQRFPGKPLAVINGKTMIQRVYEQAKKASGLNYVIIATDDSRIYDHCLSFGAQAIMTSPEHSSGTERCNEVLEKLTLNGQHYDVILNIQGDEPFIYPEQINLLADSFNNNNSVQIATLAKKVNNKEAFIDENIVKVVFDKNYKALYFSRASIPFIRHGNEVIHEPSFFKHIGLYAFRVEILKEIANLPLSALEQTEKLEQLRWLDNGYSIYVRLTEHESISIDTPQDLQSILNA